jgi:hypothetical protein
MAAIQQNYRNSAVGTGERPLPTPPSASARWSGLGVSTENGTNLGIGNGEGSQDKGEADQGDILVAPPESA